MARVSKQEKKRRRAHDAVAKALSRGRPGDAAEAWLALPADERAPDLDRLRRCVLEEMERAFERQQSDSVADWWSRVEQEPRLLPQAPRQASELRWMALTALLRTRRWASARAAWKELRPRLAEAELTAALEAFIETEGSPPPEALAPFVDVADNARMGYEDASLRKAYTAPTSDNEAAHACLVCYASEPWSRFREVVSGWLATSAPVVADAIRREAALLSFRELVVRADGRPGDALEVASFCSEMVLPLAATLELEPLMAMGIRIAARATRSPIADRTTAAACARVLRAALRFSSLVPLAERVLLAARFHGRAREDGLAALDALLSTQSSVPALLAYARLLSERAEARHGGNRVKLPPRAPDSFVRAAETVLKHPERYVEALEREEPAAESLDALLSVLPAKVSLRHVEELWPHACEELRQAMAVAVDQLLHLVKLRAADKTPPSAAELRALVTGIDSELCSMPDEVLRAFLRSAEGKEVAREFLEVRAAETRLPEHLQPAWLRIRDQVLPYEVGLLEVALEHEDGPRRRASLARRFWSRRPRLVERVQAIHECQQRGMYESCGALERRLLDGYEIQLLDASRALRYAGDHGAPHSLQRSIAGVVVNAAEAGQMNGDPDVAWALRRAAVLLPGRRKRRRRSRKSTRAATQQLRAFGQGGR